MHDGQSGNHHNIHCFRTELLSALSEATQALLVCPGEFEIHLVLWPKQRHLYIWHTEIRNVFMRELRRIRNGRQPQALVFLAAVAGMVTVVFSQSVASPSPSPASNAGNATQSNADSCDWSSLGTSSPYFALPPYLQSNVSMPSNVVTDWNIVSSRGLNLLWTGTMEVWMCPENRKGPEACI